MASRNATIAEAVKEVLKTAAATPAAFGAKFVPTRAYVPVVALDGIKALTVKVYSAGDERDEMRGDNALHDITVQVSIQKRLTTKPDQTLEEANAEIDALMELTEKVSDFFATADIEVAEWNGTEMSPPYPPHLLEERTFTAFITLTYKLLTP